MTVQRIVGGADSPISLTFAGENTDQLTAGAALVYENGGTPGFPTGSIPPAVAPYVRIFGDTSQTVSFLDGGLSQYQRITAAPLMFTGIVTPVPIITPPPIPSPGRGGGPATEGGAAQGARSLELQSELLEITYPPSFLLQQYFPQGLFTFSGGGGGAWVPRMVIS